MTKFLFAMMRYKLIHGPFEFYGEKIPSLYAQQRMWKYLKSWFLKYPLLLSKTLDGYFLHKNLSFPFAVADARCLIKFPFLDLLCLKPMPKT